MNIFSKYKKDVDNKMRHPLIPKAIKKYLEKQKFREIRKKTDEWIFVDEMVHDDVVSRYGSLVWVVLYTGEKVRDAGIIGYMLGYEPCNCAKVVWSHKTIQVTTDAMWEEYALEVVETHVTKEDIEECFKTR